MFFLALWLELNGGFVLTVRNLVFLFYSDSDWVFQTVSLLLILANCFSFSFFG